MQTMSMASTIRYWSGYGYALSAYERTDKRTPEPFKFGEFMSSDGERFATIQEAWWHFLLTEGVMERVMG